MANPNPQVPLPNIPIIGYGMHDYYVFTEPEINAFYDTMAEVAKANAPPEIPAAMAQGHLIRIAKTLKEYREKAKLLVDAVNTTERNEEQIKMHVADLIALLNTIPPAPAKNKSRVVLG